MNHFKAFPLWVFNNPLEIMKILAPLVGIVVGSFYGIPPLIYLSYYFMGLSIGHTRLGRRTDKRAMGYENALACLRLRIKGDCHPEDQTAQGVIRYIERAFADLPPELPLRKHEEFFNDAKERASEGD